MQHDPLLSGIPVSGMPVAEVASINDGDINEGDIDIPALVKHAKLRQRLRSSGAAGAAVKQSVKNTREGDIIHDNPDGSMSVGVSVGTSEEDGVDGILQSVERLGVFISGLGKELPVGDVANNILFDSQCKDGTVTPALAQSNFDLPNIDISNIDIQAMADKNMRDMASALSNFRLVEYPPIESMPQTMVKDFSELPGM
jgi:hypothetical protein